MISNGDDGLKENEEQFVLDGVKNKLLLDVKKQRGVQLFITEKKVDFHI